MRPNALSQSQLWYRAALPDLLEVASQYLLSDDAEKILASLYQQLPSCRVKTQRGFKRWAKRAVTRAAKLMAQFLDLYRNHQGLVYAAIREGLGETYRADSDFCRVVDLPHGKIVASVTAQEIAAEVWAVVLQKLGTWEPGKAKITTWIYEIALKMALHHNRTRTFRSTKESLSSIDDLAAREQQSVSH